MRDQKLQELRWRLLDTLLEEEDEMDEERGRYQRYFEFIKMKLFETNAIAGQFARS